MDWKKLLNNNRLRQSTRRNLEDARNDFESDLGRILFSPALRRMHDKTQVFPLTTDDNIHSRLTHSMEVMSVGYSLGVKCCESPVLKDKFNKDTYELFREIPVILKSVCLVHDIGNPPFGHFGETVIQNYFKKFFDKHCIKSDKSEGTNQTDGNKCLKLKLDDFQKADFTEFDGNAQGFRVLSKLQILNDAYGLNLTYATLASYIKYPNCDKINSNRIEVTKRGIFQSEKIFFEKIIDECGLRVAGQAVRHPLCYLMEAADSICYLIMDIEDGFSKKLYDLTYLYNIYKTIPCIQKRVVELYEDKKGIYKNDTTKLVNFRIEIIQQLVLLAISNFEKNIKGIENGTYSKELILDDDENKLAEKLKQICADKIFKFREITSLEITGHSVITGLLDHYLSFVFHEDKKYRKRAQSLISESILKTAFEENQLPENSNIDALNDYYKLRVIVDFVSGMTDQFALDHYQKLSGQKIN